MTSSWPIFYDSYCSMIISIYTIYVNEWIHSMILENTHIRLLVPWICCPRKVRVVNSSPHGQNVHRFADDIFKCIFMNEKFCIWIKFSLKFVPKGPISNNPSLVYIMAWHQIGDKPLSELMTLKLPTHMCVTRPQWVNGLVTGGQCCRSDNICLYVIGLRRY